MNINKKTTPSQEEEICRLYLAGSPVKAIVGKFELAYGTIARVLQSGGLKPIKPGRGTLPEGFDLDRFVALYKQGAGTTILQHEFGVKEGMVRSLLRQLGLPLRSGSEAQRMRMAYMTPEQRKAFGDKVSAANTGKKQTQATGIARALGIEVAQNLSHHERTIRARFFAAGITLRGHLAIHRYNLDLGHIESKTAVEINPNYHSMERVVKADGAKREYLIYNNWMVFYVMPHRLDEFTFQTIVSACLFRTANMHLCGHI